MATSNAFLIIFQIFLFLRTEVTTLDVFFNFKKSANKTNLEKKNILNTWLLSVFLGWLNKMWSRAPVLSVNSLISQNNTVVVYTYLFV